MDELKVKSLRVGLTLDEWRALRVRAAEHGASMAAFVSQLLRDELSQPSPTKQTRRGRKPD